MTCIVGLVHEGTVFIGGDSAGVAGLSLVVRADEKVFRNGDFLMDFTTSFRMGQLLRYNPDSPPKIVGMAFVGLQQVWGVNRGVDRALRGVSERIGNG